MVTWCCAQVKFSGAIAMALGLARHSPSVFRAGGVHEQERHLLRRFRRGKVPVLLREPRPMAGSVRSETPSPAGEAEFEKLARGLGAVVLRGLGEQLRPGGVLYNGIQRQRR